LSSFRTIPDGPYADQRTGDLDTPSTASLDDAASFLESLWSPRFPSAELVDQAADLLPHVTRARHAEQGEGPRPFIRVGPGVIEVRSKDYARADRAHERELHRREIDAEMTAEYLLEHGEFPPEPEPTRVISEWSRKSRARMVRTLGSIDFTPMYADRTRIPAMTTLTYPADWLTVVPTGRVLKAHLKAFRKRYERAWGEPLRCVWKLEFQLRGAPHVHMLMVPPHGHAGCRDADCDRPSCGLIFRKWLSLTWANVVGHPDPKEYKAHLGAGTNVSYDEGLKATDPKRVGVYFSKHSTFYDKEAQHIVPPEWQEPGCTPGRFWGYWGLEKHLAVVEVDQDTAVHAGRALRRWSAAQDVTRQITAPRYRGGQAFSAYPEVVGLAGKLLMLAHSEVSYRKVRRRARRMSNGRGFVMVNDGASMCSQLARHLSPPEWESPKGRLP
jgi:hypothetical protein